MANYKESLQSNNVDLQGILDMVNVLPDTPITVYKGGAIPDDAVGSDGDIFLVVVE